MAMKKVAACEHSTGASGTFGLEICSQRRLQVPAGRRSTKGLRGAQPGLYHRVAMTPTSRHHSLFQSRPGSPAALALAEVASHNRLLGADTQQTEVASRPELCAGQRQRWTSSHD